MALSADQLARVGSLEKNLAYNFLRDAVAEGYTTHEMVDGVVDVFTDEAGIDVKTNADYVASDDFYRSEEFDFELMVRSENETDGSTTFTDSTGNWTLTAGGDAQHDTDQSFFDSSSSMLFDGTTDFVRTLATGGTNLSSNPLTIGAKVRVPDTTGNHTIFSKWLSTGGAQSFILRIIGDTVNWITSSTGSNTALSLTSGSVISANTDHYIAVSRDSSNVHSIYVDGVRVANTTNSSVIRDNNLSWYVGAIEQSSGGNSMDGWMDEVFLLPNKALYTGASHTVPTERLELGWQALTLQGVAQTANTVPTNARMVILYSGVDIGSGDPILNTDCVLSVSRDGGTTFTDFTLTDEGEYGTIFGFSARILTTDDLDISSQPSGTSMVWKFTTSAGTRHNLYGVSLQWR